MNYLNEIKKAYFIKRLHRFAGDVLLDGKRETVHIRNTGRCRELLVEGAEIYLEKAAPGKIRKTDWSLTSVRKKDMLVNMDSMIPNRVVEEALLLGKILPLGQPDFLQREKRWGKSRFDFYYEKNGKKGFVEVKGVTLEEKGKALFPDAPTARGTRHLTELKKSSAEGFVSYVIFLIQMKGPLSFAANAVTDPAFAAEMSGLREAGVNVLVYDSIVTPESINMDNRISFP